MGKMNLFKKLFKKRKKELEWPSLLFSTETVEMLKRQLPLLEFCKTRPLPYSRPIAMLMGYPVIDSPHKRMFMYSYSPENPNAISRDQSAS